MEETRQNYLLISFERSLIINDSPKPTISPYFQFKDKSNNQINLKNVCINAQKNHQFEF